MVNAAIRAERLRQGLSRAELARRSGLHAGTVGGIERGTRRMTLDTLAAELAAHRDRTCGEGDRLVFGVTATKPFTPESVRRRSLAAWEAENARRAPGRREPC